MKKLNNNGITIAELIVSFAIVSVAVVYFFQTLLTVNKVYGSVQRETNDFINVSYTFRILDAKVNKAIATGTDLNNIEDGMCTKVNDNYSYDAKCSSITKGSVWRDNMVSYNVTFPEGTTKTFYKAIVRRENPGEGGTTDPDEGGTTDPGGGSETDDEVITYGKDLFLWKDETILVGLSEKGIKYYKNPNADHNKILKIPDGTTEIYPGAFLYFSSGANTLAMQQDINTYELCWMESTNCSSNFLNKYEQQYEINKNTSILSGYKLQLPDSIVKIDAYAFAGAGLNLKDFKILDSITYIGYKSFAGNSINVNVCLPTTVKMVNYRAFEETGILSLSKWGWSQKLHEKGVIDADDSRVTLRLLKNCP